MGLLGLTISIFTFIFYRSHPSTIKKQGATNNKNISISSSLKQILKNRNILLVIFVGICASVEFAIITYFVLFLVEELKYAVVTAGFAGRP